MDLGAPGHSPQAGQLPLVQLRQSAIREENYDIRIHAQGHNQGTLVIGAAECGQVIDKRCDLIFVLGRCSQQAPFVHSDGSVVVSDNLELVIGFQTIDCL